MKFDQFFIILIEEAPFSIFIKTPFNQNFSYDWKKVKRKPLNFNL